MSPTPIPGASYAVFSKRFLRRLTSFADLLSL
jgi:hypothetical protein